MRYSFPRKTSKAFRACLALIAVFLVGLGSTAWSASGDYAAWGTPTLNVWRITSSGHLVPGSNATRDLGTSSVKVRNAYVENITIAGTYSTDDLGATDDLTVGDDATVGDVLNVTGQLTTNAINSTGLATLDNCTVNGTLTSVLGVFSSTLNATGTATFNALVGNSTGNFTGLVTTNNATVNTTKTLTVGGPLVLGTETITANTTVTATCATVYRVTDLPNGGNILVTFDTPPAGKTILLVDESGTLGNSTSGGNITVNVTGGTINGLNNVTLTNATQVGGVYDPTTGTNVTAFRLHFPTTTSGFVYR